jgi:site-specific recombinase XerD
MGNWLTRNQAQELVNAASKDSLRGWRDGAMLGLLLGCGLRRSEVVGLNPRPVAIEGGSLGHRQFDRENAYERYLYRRGARSFSAPGSGVRE